MRVYATSRIAQYMTQVVIMCRGATNPGLEPTKTTIELLT